MADFESGKLFHTNFIQNPSENPEKHEKNYENPEKKDSTIDFGVFVDEKPSEKDFGTQEKLENDSKIEKDKEINESNVESIHERIKEAEQKKDELEFMLERVRDSIEGIDSLQEYSQEYRKPNIEDKNQTIKKHEESKQKSQLNSEKLKKFKEDQKKRELALKKKLEKVQKQLENEKKLLVDEEEKSNFIKNREYKAEIEKMKERKEKRKQELEEIKKRQQKLEEIQKSKPLYLKIEENYKKNIEMPELQHRRTELTKKELMCSPIRLSNIAEHARWYDEQKQNHQRKQEKDLQDKNITEKIRSSSYGVSSWTLKVMEDDKKLKSDLNRASQERLNMIEKKTRYAVLVKELFLPTIDKLKKQELLSLQSEKLLRKTAQKSPKFDENRLVGSDSEGKKKVLKKKKFKENPLVPKPPVKKDPKIVDFLSERRKIRDETGEKNLDIDFDWKKELEKDLPDNEIAKNLKKKAKLLEKEARKQELLMGIPGPINAKSLKQSENVNDLLLNSVKAKLAVLDHKNN